ncbi:MAG: hypothetical protein OTJ98_07510, partial [Dehalococcoidia bacterium]|nr:hypothetical protein [Dehalococcoidia bacterium]
MPPTDAPARHSDGHLFRSITRPNWRIALAGGAAIFAFGAAACGSGDVAPRPPPDTPIPATATPSIPTRVPRPTETPVPLPPPITIDGYLIETFGGIRTPGDLAFDGENVWVTMVGENTVSKLDSDGQIIATYPVGMTPRPIAFDGEFMWVGNNSVSSVTKLTLNGHEIGEFPVGGGYTSPAAMVSDGTNMWIVASWGNSLHKLAPDGEDL